MKPSPPQARYDLRPIARLETNWVAPWFILRLAQHGHIHFCRGEPTDDSHIIGGIADTFWMVAADGVGMAPRSRFGSQAACVAVEGFLGERINAGEKLSRRLITGAFEAAHTAILDLALRENRKPEDYATTLAAAVVKGNTIIGAAVGDSSIAVRSSHEDSDGNPALQLTPFCSATQLKSGTCSIHSTMWKDFIATTESNSPHISAVIVTTDGAENYMLEQRANGPEFRIGWPSHLESALRALTTRTFVNHFAYYLGIEESETSDDRTLLVAYRPPADLAPPASQSG